MESAVTTQVHIVNSSDSNPNQHTRVVYERSGSPPQVVLLAPGEAKAWWIGTGVGGIADTISLCEVFQSKAEAVADAAEADAMAEAEEAPEAEIEGA